MSHYHKFAGELKRKDKFLMAGGHYEILDIYETDNDDVIKFVFNHVNAPVRRRFVMILDRSALFVIT